MNIIGIDFSLNKTGITIFDTITKEYKFFLFPYNFTDNNIKQFINCGVNVILRGDEVRLKEPTASEKVRNDVTNARNYAKLIVDTLKPYINKETIVAFEGSSFASKGNVALQLTAYRYILVDRLIDVMDIKNIFSYSPQTLKKTAECSQKGKSKNDMIEAFITYELGIKNLFQECLLNDKLQNKNAKWLDGVDDIIDSFFALQTYLKLEK